MDNKKIGEFISTLRRNRSLTQKDLADRLGITDKAVSKWERGAGYPDISLLRPLADILGTSVNELLEGEISQNTSGTSENDVDNALVYADQLITMKENTFGKIMYSIVSICFILAISTCIIVNVAVNHKLSWSILVIDGCFMGAMLTLPPLRFKKRGLLYSLCLLTIFLLPFLAVIEFITSGAVNLSGWVWRIGVPVSIVWLITIWIMVLLFTKTKIRIWYLISFSILLCIPGQIITNYIVDLFTKFAPDNSDYISNISTIAGLLALAGIFLTIGLNKRKMKVNS